jgi:hypothetical protein
VGMSIRAANIIDRAYRSCQYVVRRIGIPWLVAALCFTSRTARLGEANASVSACALFVTVSRGTRLTAMTVGVRQVKLIRIEPTRQWKAAQRHV